MGSLAAAIVVLISTLGPDRRIVCRAAGDETVQKALAVLGRPVPVRVVAPSEIRQIYGRVAAVPPSGLIAFRAPGDRTDATIYVNSDSDVYRSASRKASGLALLKLAATLVHEQVHDTDGEAAAYRRQSDFVRDRLKGLPWRDREAAWRYVRELDARADAFLRVADVLRLRQRRGDRGG